MSELRENKLCSLKKLNALALRGLALLFMFLGHLKKVVIAAPHSYWMMCVANMAPAIFAFQISEGFHYTSNRKKYALRLLIFAAVSELPFNLMAGGWIVPSRQNVMFTLLLGLLALWLLQWGREQGTTSAMVLSVAGTVGMCCAAQVLHMDHGMLGVLAVVLFGLSRDKAHKWLWQLAGMVLIYIVMYQLIHGKFQNWFVTLHSWMAVAALIPIWLYNGKRGSKNKFLQIGAYLFYPVHILLLVLIRHFV